MAYYPVILDSANIVFGFSNIQDDKSKNLVDN